MEPLASKIRPKTLKEFVGQDHLVGEGKPLNVAKKRFLTPFSPILAAVLAGRERADLKENLKRRKGEDREVIVFAKSVVIKFLTRVAFPARRFSAQNVKLT